MILLLFKQNNDIHAFVPTLPLQTQYSCNSPNCTKIINFYFKLIKYLSKNNNRENIRIWFSLETFQTIFLLYILLPSFSLDVPDRSKPVQKRQFCLSLVDGQQFLLLVSCVSYAMSELDVGFVPMSSRMPEEDDLLSIVIQHPVQSQTCGIVSFLLTRLVFSWLVLSSYETYQTIKIKFYVFNNFYHYFYVIQSIYALSLRGLTGFQYIRSIKVTFMSHLFAHGN